MIPAFIHRYENLFLNTHSFRGPGGVVRVPDSLGLRTSVRGNWLPVASRGLPFPLVVSRGLPWSPVVSRGLPWHPVASRGLPWPLT